MCLCAGAKMAFVHRRLGWYMKQCTTRSISRKMYAYVLIAISTHTYVCSHGPIPTTIVIERFVFVSISATIMKACPPDL